MDEEIVQQIVDEVLSSLEPLDTQGAAVLQLLKAKGIADDEEMASYLEQAGKASNVRWLAARVRIKSLIASAMRTQEERPAKQPVVEESTKSGEKNNEPVANEETAKAEGSGTTGQDSEERNDESRREKPVTAGEGNESKKEPQANEDTKQEAA